MTTKWLNRQGNPLQGCLHAANQQKKKKKNLYNTNIRKMSTKTATKENPPGFFYVIDLSRIFIQLPKKPFIFIIANRSYKNLSLGSFIRNNENETF